MSIDGKLFRSRTNHAGKLSSSCRCSKSGSTLLAEMKLFKHTRPIKTVAAMLVYRPMVTDTDSHKNCWQVQQSIPSSPLLLGGGYQPTPAVFKVFNFETPEMKDGDGLH